MPETMPFTITELTGSERSVELRDRCLPYRPLSMPGEQRLKKTHYSGNPVATIQVLGPDETKAEAQGRWKDRFLRMNDQVKLTGWDSIVTNGETPTVEQLVQIFHIIRRSGNALEVRWGPEIRRGVLVRFDPGWRRLDIAEWTMAFEWSQYGVSPPSPFTNLQSTRTMTAELAAALASVNDIRAGMPTIMFPDVIAQALTLGAAIGAATLELNTAVADVSGLPSVTQKEFQGVASKTEDVIANCEELRRFVGDVPVTQLIPTDVVIDLLEGATWSRDMSAALVTLAATAVTTRETIRDRTVSGYLADIRVRGGQSLRDIARQYYGSPDDWALIADANGLVGSLHPDGTRILVPRREAGGGRAT